MEWWSNFGRVVLSALIAWSVIEMFSLLLSGPDALTKSEADHLDDPGETQWR